MGLVNTEHSIGYLTFGHEHIHFKCSECFMVFTFEIRYAVTLDMRLLFCYALYDLYSMVDCGDFGFDVSDTNNPRLIY